MLCPLFLFHHCIMETDCCSHLESQPGLRALGPVSKKCPSSFPLQQKGALPRLPSLFCPLTNGHCTITYVSLQDKIQPNLNSHVGLPNWFLLLFLTKSKPNELPFNSALKLSNNTDFIYYFQVTWRIVSVLTRWFHFL